MNLPELPSTGIRAALVAGFFALALCVYGGSLHNGFVRWDDSTLIYQNPAVMETSPASITRAFTTYDPELYIPLTLISYQADYLLGGGAPFMFHFQSLLWHVLNALLVCWITFLLFKNRLVAVAIGLLFLLHPLHTEAVAWASGRKDVLSTFFFLSSLTSYLYYREGNHTRLYWLSIGLFALGLLSKVMVLTLPVVLLIILFREKGNIKKRDLLEMVPYAALSALFCIIALFGKTEVNAASTLMEKILMAAKSSLFYIQKLIWPLDLSVVYPYPSAVSLAEPGILMPAVIIVLLLAAAVATLKYTREVAAWFGFYLITLAPTFINIAKGEGDVYSASDRYAYIPSIGLLFLLAAFLVDVLSREGGMRKERARNQTFSGIAAVVLVLCAILTARQSMVWKNTLTLFEHAIAHAPAPSYVAHNNLGNAYGQQKEYERAIEQFNTSLSLKQHPRTYTNLGATYRRMGNFDKAEDAYAKALALDPQSALAYFGLGMVRAARGEEEKALAAYAHVLELDPEMSAVHVNVGALYAAKGKYQEAIDAYDRALTIDPFSADAYYNRAVTLADLQRYKEAVESYEKAIDLQPQAVPARINLALLYARDGERNKAIEQFRAILRIDPKNPAALSALNQLGVPER